MGKWKKGLTSTAVHRGESYVGRVFGEWEVLGFAKNTGAPDYNHIWSCLCRGCGKTYEVNKESLVLGVSTRCLKCAGKQHQKANNPNWKGFKDIPGSFFWGVVDGAKARGISVRITIEQVQELWERSGRKCVLSGIPIEIGKDASLDRIDSKKGYLQANLQWVHKDVNRMKNFFPQGHFIALCKQIAVRNL